MNKLNINQNKHTAKLDAETKKKEENHELLMHGLDRHSDLGLMGYGSFPCGSAWIR